MKKMLLAATLPLLLGCGVREIPPHLQVEASPSAQAPVSPATTPAEAIAILVGADPLVRRPRLPPAGWLASLDDAGLLAWDAAARATPPDLDRMGYVEATHRGSVAVPLSRGWKLGAVEAQMSALLAGDRAAEREALTLLGGLGPAPPISSGRGPWSWLTARVPAHPDILLYGEARVLRGWLDGPDIPTEAVAEALAASPRDALRGLVEGQLLEHRHRAAAGGLPDLRRVQTLVLLVLDRAAADRDAEQDAHRARVAETLSTWGLPTDGADPLPAAADAVLAELIPLAADDEAMGGALLARALRRWMGGCEGCEGLDRVDSLAAAARWAPALAPWVRAARVACFKDAVDRFEVALAHGQEGRARLALADVLLGLGRGPLPLTWLERVHADPGTWLTLTRALGAPDAAVQDEALAALRAALAEEARLALEDDPPAELARLIERVARRAAP